MEEIRKEIPWMPEGKYFVSNLGRVKNGNVKNRKGRILKFESNHYGHQRIKLYGSGGRNDVRHYQVHRLVYCVFNNLDYDYGLDKAQSKCTGLVCHKDNNPLNNRLDNLYMGTSKENMQQCIRDGRFKFLEAKYGADNNKAILTDDLVLEITRRVRNGETQRAVAKDLGISNSTVNSVWKGRSRKHVSRETSDEFGETPTGTIPSQASQGGEEGVETNSIPLEQGGSGHERPTSNES